jgi:hypothetical protein
MVNDSQSKELLRLETFQRGNEEHAEQLRISLDEFTSDDGKRHRYVSIRLWYEAGRGEWRPTKKGTTIRRKELEQAAKALSKAAELIEDEDPAEADKALQLRRRAEGATPKSGDQTPFDPISPPARAMARQSTLDELDQERVF